MIFRVCNFFYCFMTILTLKEQLDKVNIVTTIQHKTIYNSFGCNSNRKLNLKLESYSRMLYNWNRFNYNGIFNSCRNNSDIYIYLKYLFINIIVLVWYSIYHNYGIVFKTSYLIGNVWLLKSGFVQKSDYHIYCRNSIWTFVMLVIITIHCD